MENLLFTPAAILNLLLEIDELADLEIGITETMDDKIQLQIGDSVYEISDENATDIPVDDAVVDKIEDVNDEAYEELADEDAVVLEPVESGIIKELAKNVLVGGLVRMGAGALTK